MNDWIVIDLNSHQDSECVHDSEKMIIYKYNGLFSQLYVNPIALNISDNEYKTSQNVMSLYDRQICDHRNIITTSIIFHPFSTDTKTSCIYIRNDLCLIYNQDKTELYAIYLYEEYQSSP